MVYNKLKNLKIKIVEIKYSSKEKIEKVACRYFRRKGYLPLKAYPEALSVCNWFYILRYCQPFKKDYKIKRKIWDEIDNKKLVGTKDNPFLLKDGLNVDTLRKELGPSYPLFFQDWSGLSYTDIENYAKGLIRIFGKKLTDSWTPSSISRGYRTKLVLRKVFLI